MPDEHESFAVRVARRIRNRVADIERIRHYGDETPSVVAELREFADGLGRLPEQRARPVAPLRPTIH